MNQMSQFIRRLVIRWQIRSLELQAQSIVEARNHALARLMHIRREQGVKQVELWMTGSEGGQKIAM